MNRSLTTVLIASLGLSVGCHREAKPELAEVPPPVEPVQVLEYPAEPVQSQSVAPVPVAPEPMTASTSYTIRKGDTLWKIAESHYGSGLRWQDIAAANPGVNPKKLAVGQTLTLP